MLQAGFFFFLIYFVHECHRLYVGTCLGKASINNVPSITGFTKGKRHADINSNTDKVAEYGVGAPVEGGVISKTNKLGAIGKLLVTVCMEIYPLALLPRVGY